MDRFSWIVFYISKANKVDIDCGPVNISPLVLVHKVYFISKPVMQCMYGRLVMWILASLAELDYYLAHSKVLSLLNQELLYFQYCFTFSVNDYCTSPVSVSRLSFRETFLSTIVVFWLLVPLIKVISYSKGILTFSIDRYSFSLIWNAGPSKCTTQAVSWRC